MQGFNSPWALSGRSGGGSRAHGWVARPCDSGKIPWGFGRRFWQVPVGIPWGFCWGSPRGPSGFCWDSARVLWGILLEPTRGLGASARPAQAPHASTQRRRRIATTQACSKSLLEELRAARVASWAAHHPRSHDSLAEWSKALASGASPKGRGFEPHSRHYLPQKRSVIIFRTP